ncbi:MAG: OmpH family outer membrane protein [Chitinophagales bacterium]|nr:OmpH family outer membrane protein [Chitinophagales bacterium]
MKKVFFTLAVVAMTAFASQVNAQIKAYKFGYVNSLELLDAIPEKKTADAEIDKYGNDLYTSLEKMYGEYQKKIQDFQKGVQEGKISEIDQEFKAKEIQDLEKRIQDFQDGAEEKVGKKRQTLYQPLVDKINKAIADVAKEGGYTYIFDSSSGNILHADESENIINVLKKKLGLPVTAPASK